MNYVASKIRLSPFIYESMTKVVGKDPSGYILCDLFAGTGVIGRLFGKMKYTQRAFYIVIQKGLFSNIEINYLGASPPGIQRKKPYPTST